MKEIVLVTGGTGNVGLELVRLLARDEKCVVRAGARDPLGKSAERARLLGSNVEPVAFDVDRPATLDAALRDATRVYVLPPFVESMTAWHHLVADAIARAPSVRYVVKHSVAGARASTAESEPSLIPRLHFEGEQLIAATGKPWSVIRPTIFAQHLTTMNWVYRRHDAAFHMPIGAGKAYFLDARDIAALAAHLLGASDPTSYFGQAYNLTGPELVGGHDIARILSEVAGRPIAWDDCSPKAFAERMTELGSSAWNTEQALHVYDDTREGWLGKFRGDDLQRVAGVASRSFTQFARDHVDFFRAKP